MRFSSILAAVAATTPTLIAAHGDEYPVPKVFGRSSLELKSRQLSSRSNKARAANSNLNTRQSTDRCGAGVGSCAAGLCCSAAGYCGSTPAYCNAPDCQFNYGPACDANIKPAGSDTSSVARPKLGSVPYGGAGIYDCNVAGTVALTYDDGPYIYTNDILDIFAKYNAKATFFITGNNNGKGEIDNPANAWPAVIKRMYSEGHQIASHTWSHQDLSAITSAQRKQQMTYNEMALRNVLGFFPTYMRPPYSSCNAACQADMGALGYHVTYFDIDTDDYNQDSPSKIQNSKNRFSDGLVGPPSDNDYLVIGHDIHEQTAHNLTEYMLQTLQARGYRAVTVGECLGDDAANWYRSSSGSASTSVLSNIVSSTSRTSSAPTSSAPSSSAPASSATKVSQDGSCGAASALQTIAETASPDSGPLDPAL
ncbi:hypothetical protein LTS18_003215 [Coniosporium uncinatum]|uniref:Uncharacterized protein n=1 Tax=Coniosporium uncinatum TaxID=93489 RepID=A0ACC3DYM8_9PEZI|nr:hypothetical protein LTS18_003215 [Coniosporium uncinatum]